MNFVGQTMAFPEEHIEDWTILIVDDHPDNVIVASTTLEFYGATVLQADNGQTALELLNAKNVQPTAILLDIDMPVMDGWEFFAAVRENKALDDTVIIAVTAHAMERDRRRAREAGFDDYIDKPYDVRLLVPRMRKAVESRNKKEE